MFDLTGSVGADVVIPDPTVPTFVQQGWAQDKLPRECEKAKGDKHVLPVATMVPLVMTTFGKLGPFAVAYLNSLADVACSVGLVERLRRP